MGEAETRRAIEAANRAYPAWRAKTAKERAKILRTWFDLMMANQEDLARIMTAEQGKPIAESRGEIAYAASFIEWFGEEAKRVYGDTIPAHLPGRRIGRDQGAGRRLRRHHALELPGGHDHPQGRPGAGRRLPDRDQARDADALLRLRDGRAGRAGRGSGRRAQRADRLRQGDRRRDDDATRSCAS